MEWRTFYGNVLLAPQGCYLVHAISGDFSLGAGVAKKIDEVYQMKEKLNTFYVSQRDKYRCLLVDNVFNLVVKNEIYETVTYDHLKEALLDMKEQMIYLHVYKLAMPKICTGKDKLEWNKVKEIIEEVFKYYPYSLEIIYYEYK